MNPGFLFLAAFIVLILASAIKVIPEYERAVIFRLGRLVGEKGPGLIILIPIVDRMVRVTLRTVVTDVQPQDVITEDNVSVKVNAVIYFRVMDAVKSVVEVENYIFATIQFAQTTLRSILGESELDELLAEREKINKQIQTIVDQHTDPWGIKVSAVEIKDVDLPEEMRRVMARQAEAERDRRSKVIHAEGEFQAAERLSNAAEILQRHSSALQLRFLSTLTEVAAENNSTIVFPIPIDLFAPYIEGMKKHLKPGE